MLRDGREIASLTISMSAAPLLAVKQADMIGTLWRSLLTSTLSSALILWVMQVFVLRPMSGLTRAAGKLDEPLQLQGAHEISRAGLAMEGMRRALPAAFAALRQHAARWSRRSSSAPRSSRRATANPPRRWSTCARPRSSWWSPRSWHRWAGWWPVWRMS